MWERARPSGSPVYMAAPLPPPPILRMCPGAVGCTSQMSRAYTKLPAMESTLFAASRNRGNWVGIKCKAPAVGFTAGASFF